MEFRPLHPVALAILWRAAPNDKTNDFSISSSLSRFAFVFKGNHHHERDAYDCQG